MINRCWTVGRIRNDDNAYDDWSNRRWLRKRCHCARRERSQVAAQRSYLRCSSASAPKSHHCCGWDPRPPTQRESATPSDTRSSKSMSTLKHISIDENTHWRYVCEKLNNILFLGVCSIRNVVRRSVPKQLVIILISFLKFFFLLKLFTSSIATRSRYLTKNERCDY